MVIIEYPDEHAMSTEQSSSDGISFQESVSLVMRECACSKERALKLLRVRSYSDVFGVLVKEHTDWFDAVKLYNNNVALAKRHHEEYVKYTKPSSGQSQVPDSAPPWTRAPKRGHSRGATDDPPESGESSTSFFSMPGCTPRSDGSSIHSHQTDEPYQQGTTSAQRLEERKTVREEPELRKPGRDWDFILPRVPNSRSSSEYYEFAPRVLVRVIQHDITIEAVRNYLEAFERASVESQINDEVDGFPLIFYGVGTNNKGILKLLINFGADVSAVHSTSQTPLLAFAIVSGAIEQTDSTTIISTLLSHGASPDVIPSEVFTPFNQDPPTGSSFKRDQKSDGTKLTAWCTDASRARLAKAANLTQRYYLERATKLKKPAVRQRQVAKLKKAENLLGLQYVFLGQSVATELLTKTLLAHLLKASKSPLVLCFAGPSGHGKTELAQQLGRLLSLDLEVVDCTNFSYEMQLFGPRLGYEGSGKGSPVNNFLAEHSGQRSIVFFDEFEKTKKEIHDTLLLLFENGKYQDRRDNGKVDCLNTIWILATNALDSTVMDFFEQNSKIVDGDDDEKLKLSKQLSKKLRQTFLHRFEPPLTGRVSDFVPFLPFSPGEQDVITHKMLLQLAEGCSRPIVTSDVPGEQLFGNIRLKIRRDATVCRLLAAEHYDKNLGARSLKAGVRKVDNLISQAYLEEEGEIQENGGLQDYIIDVQGDDIVVRAGQRSS